MLAKVKKNCKYEIRRAEKEGAITCIYRDKHALKANEVINKFKKVYNEMFKAKDLEYYFNEDLFLAGIEAKQLVVTTNTLSNIPDCVVCHAYLVDGTSAVLMYSASPLLLCFQDAFRRHENYNKSCWKAYRMMCKGAEQE